MNRRSFLRRFAKAVAVAAVAPTALASLPRLTKVWQIPQPGIYAQLQACKPIGAPALDLPLLIQQMHEFNRIRHPSAAFEIMTDRKTAGLIQDSMVKYYYSKHSSKTACALA